MKIEAINQIIRLTEEGSLKKISERLPKLNRQKELNLSQHYDEIKSKYEVVLKKTDAMILIEDVLLIHVNSIKDFGGSRGKRCRVTGISNCLSLPDFWGEDSYPSPFAKVAAAGERLIVNNPFIDGNNRTGIIVMIALLRE